MCASISQLIRGTRKPPSGTVIHGFLVVQLQLSSSTLPVPIIQIGCRILVVHLDLSNYALPVLISPNRYVTCTGEGNDKVYTATSYAIIVEISYCGDKI